MHLQVATLKKFAREALVTSTPLVLDENGIAALKSRLDAWFAHVEELTPQWYTAKGYVPTYGGLARALCSVSVKHPQSTYSYGGFALGLDAENGLRLTVYQGANFPVGSLDELVAFLTLCRERAGRLRGQLAKRNKVRKLRGAAILARVQEMARAHQFDYRISESTAFVSLSLRFDGQHVVEVSIPFAQFDAALTQFEAALPQLRDLVRGGVAAHLRPKATQVARSRQWVLHQTLGEADPDADEAEADN